MSTRRRAREWAVQLLFQLDANPDSGKTPAEAFDAFWDGEIRLGGGAEPDAGTAAASVEPRESPDDRSREFCEELVCGVMHHRAEIDELLSQRLKNWTLDRVGAAERAVLRMGVYELVFAPDPSPAAVIINEAVDLAKYFSTSRSGPFVNGILDAIARRQRDRKPAVPETWSPEPPAEK